MRDQRRWSLRKEGEAAKMGLAGVASGLAGAGSWSGKGLLIGE